VSAVIFTAQTEKCVA